MLAGKRRGDNDDEGELELKEMNNSFLASATPEGLRQLDELAKENGADSIDQFIESTLRSRPGLSSEDRQLSEDLYKDDVGEKPVKSSFWFDEEDPDTNTEEQEFDEDDITSMAHGKLEEVREMRHYTRLAVWDMPLLSSKCSRTNVFQADAQTGN
jgi:small subunit ribosomal protein S35